MNSTSANGAGTRKLWTLEEDQRLRYAVSRCTTSLSWVQVATMIEGRTPAACSDRWRNHLDPQVAHPGKVPFSDFERTVMSKGVQLYGHSWSKIARWLPGRTSDHVRSFCLGAQSKGQPSNRYMQYTLDQLLCMSAGRPGQDPQELPATASGTALLTSQTSSQGTGSLEAGQGTQRVGQKRAAPAASSGMPEKRPRLHPVTAQQQQQQQQQVRLNNIPGVHPLQSSNDVGTFSPVLNNMQVVLDSLLMQQQQQQQAQHALARQKQQQQQQAQLLWQQLQQQQQQQVKHALALVKQQQQQQAQLLWQQQQQQPALLRQGYANVSRFAPVVGVNSQPCIQQAVVQQDCVDAAQPHDAAGRQDTAAQAGHVQPDSACTIGIQCTSSRDLLQLFDASSLPAGAQEDLGDEELLLSSLMEWLASMGC